jgi:hypothetical protein
MTQCYFDFEFHRGAKMSLPKLPACFKEPSKTLKLEAEMSHPFQEVANQAYNYLHSPGQETYNRIEVKYGKTYLVVAKLKDRG